MEEDLKLGGLDPYVCLFERCNQPYNLYPSRKQWLHHMRSEHLVKWTCVVEHDPVIEFGTHNELTQHMTQSHWDIYGELLSFVPSMAEACKNVPEVVFESCPFCDGTPDNNLVEHIEFHLQYLALESI